MPNKSTMKKARRDLRAGKSATTAAGEFVHEEIRHVREGKHGARSAKQAIAIGLAKARRAGVPVKPRGGRAASRRAEQRDLATGQGKRSPRSRSRRRSRATKRALAREPHRTVSRAALSRQARRTAHRRRGRKSK